ncbi:hypothetical protein ACFUC1_15490 [Pedococcus sp. NPDC057267]|uniref:hypothetical protein n=1 Tax=Pedococcus sp. NPDC057267 TaxID=3346077 RepID=UPI00362D2843
MSTSRPRVEPIGLVPGAGSRKRRLNASAARRHAPTALFCLLLLLTARTAGTGLSDPDTPWHVLAGRHLWTTGAFSGPDPYSSFTTKPWVLNQWLPDLLLAAADHLGGLPAVVWLAQAWRVLLCVLLLIACRQRADGLSAASVAAVAVLGTADSLSPRPQLVGFALLVITVSAWLNTASDGRPRWWLLLVAYVWACSHGTWVVGVTVGIATILGMLADRRLDRKSALRLASIPLGSAALAVLTPLGPALLTSFQTVHAVSPYIQEWRAPTSATLSVIATSALLLVVPVAWVARRSTWSWTYMTLWLVGLVWSVSSMRTVAVGAIIVAPIAASAVSAAVRHRRRPVSTAERVLVAWAAALSLVASAVLAAHTPETPVGVPHRFDTLLSNLPAGTVVYNADALGGWLMYSHPQLSHTADTRAEIYGPILARSYLDVMAARPGWEEDLEHFAPRAVILEKGLPVVDALRSRGWQVLGADAGYVLLEPGTPR